jgi:hypothetical protein
MLGAAADWFVRRGHEVRGPLGADQLRELARRGRIRADDLVRHGGDQRWLNAASIPGLLQPPAARSAAPPANQATPNGNMAARRTPAIQPRQPASAPGRKKKRPKRTAFWVVLASTVSFVLLGGGGMIFLERGMFSFDFGGDSEASARAALSAELDKWMARQTHGAVHFELLMAVLLDYSIQSLDRVKTDITDVPYEDWDNYHGPEAVHSEMPTSYLATVRVNVQSQAGTALPRVILYRLTRDPKAHKWQIRSTFNGK